MSEWSVPQPKGFRPSEIREADAMAATEGLEDPQTLSGQSWLPASRGVAQETIKQRKGTIGQPLEIMLSQTPGPQRGKMFLQPGACHLVRSESREPFLEPDRRGTAEWR